MLCKNPFTTPGGAAYGCSRCLPCLYNRRRVWTYRIEAEATAVASTVAESGRPHGPSSFGTLTYTDENMPRSSTYRPTLEPMHLQSFMKRLRSAYAPAKLRFFGVGEYGDKTERPHYHVALFGFPPCAYGQSRYSARLVQCCYWCDLVRDTWGFGHILLGTLERDSAQYICGYTVKKMTRSDDPRLGDRHPEFARMSLKPGIGRDAMWEIADVLMRYGLDVTELDVPGIVLKGRIPVPIGRYLKTALRKMVGRDDKTPQAILDQLAATMRVLQLRARSDSENPSFKGQLQAAQKGRLLNFEGRAKLYKRERLL